MEGFTLAALAFPVAPATLDGFTLDGFAWVDVIGGGGGPAPPRVSLVAVDSRLVSLAAVGGQGVTMTAVDSSRVTLDLEA